MFMSRSKKIGSFANVTTPLWTVSSCMCFNNSVYRPAVSSAYSVHFLKLEFSRHGSFRGRSGAESVLVSLERRLLRSSGGAPDLLMDLHAVSCFLILLTCTGVCFGQEVTLPEEIKIETGQDVEITPLKIPDPTPVTFRWLFNGSFIISVFPGGNITSSGYIGRISVSTITLALKLRNLTKSDTGLYTLSLDTDKGIITGHTSLQVLGACFGQEVTLPEKIKIETGQDVEITPLKIPDPTPFTFKWLFNGSLIIIVFPGGNITSPGYIGRISVNTITLALKLRNLTESDTGPYILSVDTDKGIITGQTSLQLLDKGTISGNGDSLSAGAIAGIVIGVLLGLAGIAGLMFYFMKAKEMPKTMSRGNQQNKATHNAQHQDSHYVNMTMSRTDTQMGHTAQPDNDINIYEN